MSTAIGTYATLAGVKARLNITDTTDDALLTDFCNEVNQLIETECGRVLAPWPFFQGGLGAASAVGDQTVTVGATTVNTTINVGDTLAFGAVTSTPHESAQVLAVSGALVTLATALGAAYPSNTPVQTVYLYDGFTALENGKVLPVPEGIQYVSSLEVSTFTAPTGGAVGSNVVWYRLPSTDYWPSPHIQSRAATFWPALELHITNVPQPPDTTPSFFPGSNNVRIWGAIGFFAQPDDIVRLARNVVVAAYRERGTGGGNVTTIASDGSVTIEKYLSTADWRLIAKYRAVSRDAFLL